VSLVVLHRYRARLHHFTILLTGHGVPPATETMFLPLSTKRGELLQPLHDLPMGATNTQHPVLPMKSCHIVGELAVRWAGERERQGQSG